MIFFGDLFQLPPVIASEFEKGYLAQKYESPYFFSAQIFSDPETDFEMLELNTVYRQDDQRFIRLLDSLRTNELDWDDMEELNERYIPPESEEDRPTIILSGRNKKVDEINRQRLDQLSTPEFQYLARIEGDFSEKLAPTSPMLKLKVGAQVMFLKNDPEKAFVNGTLGRISYLTEDKIRVAILDDGGDRKEIEVDRMDWEFIRYGMDEKNPGEIKATVLGTFRQYPLRLAWAITIHKSQGKTFDRVFLDLGEKGAFEYGQTYVALSRCTRLDGIFLRRPLRAEDILVDQRIVDFLEDKRRN
jgi:ATP-dependent exoDNAse (exonuclease V) alpha subunit